MKLRSLVSMRPPSLRFIASPHQMLPNYSVEPGELPADRIAMTLSMS